MRTYISCLQDFFSCPLSFGVQICTKTDGCFWEGSLDVLLEATEVLKTKNTHLKVNIPFEFQEVIATISNMTFVGILDI